MSAIKKRNFVAKNARVVNKAATHPNKKRAAKNGQTKHKRKR
jgi:hypothetical protein